MQVGRLSRISQEHEARLRTPTGMSGRSLQEVEEEYLDRMGLLVPGEFERIEWEDDGEDDDDGDEPALCGAGA